MKPFITIILLLQVAVAFAQQRVVMFYNYRWENVAANSNKISYYRRANLIDNTDTNYQFEGKVSDLYLGGKPQMVGYYLKGKKHGNFRFYHSNGQMAQKGAYQNNRRVGKWTYWYPNGKLKQILIYTNNDFEVQDYFDKTGTQKVKNGTGKWQTFAYNRIREKTLLKAYFKQGKKQGTWEYYQPDYLKKPLFKEKYAQGVLKKTIAGLMTPVSKFNRYDLAQLKFEYTEAFKSDYKVKRRADGSIQYKLFINTEKTLLQNLKKPNQPAKYANPFAHIPTDISDVKIYTKVSQKAYLIKKAGVVQPSIRYPTQARRQGIQGVVVVEFVVEKNGKTSMIQVSKGIGGGCDQEAIRVVKLAKYHPAINNGKRVRTRLSIPLSFKLD